MALGGILVGKRLRTKYVLHVAWAPLWQNQNHFFIYRRATGRITPQLAIDEQYCRPMIRASIRAPERSELCAYDISTTFSGVISDDLPSRRVEKYMIDF